MHLKEDLETLASFGETHTDKAATLSAATNALAVLNEPGSRIPSGLLTAVFFAKERRRVLLQSFVTSMMAMLAEDSKHTGTP